MYTKSRKNLYKNIYNKCTYWRAFTIFFGLYINRRIFIHIYLLILSLRLRTKARMPKFTDSKCFFKFKKVILVHESLLRGSKPLLALLLLTLQKIYILYSIHKIFLREIDFTKVNCISIVVFSWNWNIANMASTGSEAIMIELMKEGWDWIK